MAVSLMKTFGLGCLYLAMAGSMPVMAETAVDLILTNGHIKTSTGWAQAMAIRDGVIVAVGEAKTIAVMRSAETEVLDLGGDTVLPGLHDVHVHPVYAGVRARECSIPQGSTLERTQKIVKACADKAAPGVWITGGQWDAPALGQAPHRAMLDAVSADHPIFLEDTSGHSSWVNSKALTLAGITKDTPNPKGGIIERDASGVPTGIFREAAVEMVRKHMPVPAEQEVRAALAWSLNKMLSYGITSFTEAAVGFSAGAERELKAYAALSDAGQIKQRVRLCLTWDPNDKASDAVVASRNFYARDRLSPDCVKIFLDGVPTDSHTAAMLEPYHGTVEGRSDEASRTGLLLVRQDILNDAVTRFDRMGLTVKFHAAGDAAVRAGLNAIAAARNANGFSGQLHDAGHCTFVAKEDVSRARAIGATFEVSPYLWGPSPINDSIIEAVGDERLKRVWPVRDMIEAGALVVPGSDWSVVPSVNPWIGIETLVTRQKPGGSGESFGKAEAISLDQAMDMFTINAARHRGVADKVGRIEPGMLADVIVVDQDPYAVPITQVHATSVKMTFINGEKVFDAASVSAPQADIKNNWLMMVVTKNTDPAREAAFNEWYDKIDIPDVLQVPGYRRARRGLEQRTPEFPATPAREDEGNYVALYNIESGDMDGTIIDMLMASWNMEKAGQSTDLLKVTERVYYHQYTPTYEAPKPEPAGTQEYIYIVKIDCCRDAAAELQFNRWYDHTYIPDMATATGFLRATRYKLHRVVMSEPKEMPNFLAVYEIAADSAAQAIKNMRAAEHKLSKAGHLSDLYVAGGVRIYRKITDVKR